MFKDIKFINLESINFCNDDVIIKGFSSLNAFQLIKINKLEIETINKDYKCYLKCQNPRFTRIFIFNDLNFLKENFLENTEEIKIPQEIFDDVNNWNFFSYNEIKNSFPIFKKMKFEYLYINYYNNKYFCSAKVDSYIFKMNFIFEDLNFIFYDLFNEIKKIDFYNIILKGKIGITKEKFPKLEYLGLYRSKIESIDFFSEIVDIKSFLYIYSSENTCEGGFYDFFDENKFIAKEIITKEDKIEITYCSPIYVCLYLDKFEKLKSFKECEMVRLNNLSLTDEDVKSMHFDEMNYLRVLDLNGNKITNLNFLNNIFLKNSDYYLYIYLKNNLIDSGIETIIKNKSEKLKSIEIKLKEDGQNMHLISFEFEFFGKYFLFFDYLSDINNNLDVLKEINFEKIECLNLSGIKLKILIF